MSLTPPPLPPKFVGGKPVVSSPKEAPAIAELPKLAPLPKTPSLTPTMPPATAPAVSAPVVANEAEPVEVEEEVRPVLETPAVDRHEAPAAPVAEENTTFDALLHPEGAPTGTQKEEKKKSSTVTWLLLGLLVVAAGAAGYYFFIL